MNKRFVELTEYRILQFIGSGDGISSLKHKLDSRIAASNAIVSHLPGIKKIEQIIAGRLSEILALIYIPFGKRGKDYVNNILSKMNKKVEEYKKEHILYIVRDDISDNDIKHINIATNYSNLDLNNIPIPTYETLPYIMFELYEMLDELNRADLWPEIPYFSTRNNIEQYICYHIEKEGKIILPEEVLERLTSNEFINFENSNLTEKEEKYLIEYLNKINFL